MLALCLPLPYTYALLGTLGLVSSTATALALGLGNTAINNGLYGFNGVLVGQAAATFLVLDSPAQVSSAAVAVVLFAAVAGLLTHGLGNLLIHHHKVHTTPTLPRMCCVAGRARPRDDTRRACVRMTDDEHCRTLALTSPYAASRLIRHRCRPSPCRSTLRRSCCCCACGHTLGPSA